MIKILQEEDQGITPALIEKSDSVVIYSG